jgi:WhiB family transcriptional regulator, redox-sensing transcriptional regulator
MAAVESIQFETQLTTLADLGADGNADSWREHAVCKGRTQLFFPPKAERPQARVRRESQARLLCSTCPVAEPCREFARGHHEYGFWGGESEEDRHLAGYTVAAPIGVRARAALG